MYDKETINRIKENIDIVDIVRENLPSLKSAGRDFKALSPFTNEKTPSFVVSRDKQFFKDFSSGKGGDVFAFVQQFHNMSFGESIEFLADKAGIELTKNQSVKTNLDKIDNIRKAITIASDFFHNNLLKKQGEAYHYLFNRGISNESIVEFQIGYASDSWNELYNYLKKYEFEDELLIEAGLIKSKNNKVYDAYRNRIIFPIRDDLGRVVGLGGRIIKNDEKSAKYINSPQNLIYDKSKLLYGLYESKREINNLDQAILVEGYLDVISLNQYGVKNVIASSGTALSEHQLRIISRHSQNLYIIFDSDKAGINAANKVMDLALQNNINIKLVQLPDGEDPDSIIHHYGKNTFNQYVTKAIDFIEFRISTSKDLNNPNYQADLLRGIVNSIKLIPDRLKHDFYIKRASDILKLSETQITNVYAEKVNIEKKERRKNFDKTLSQASYKEDARESIETFANKINDLLDSEIIILKYILNNYEDFHEIVEEYELGEDSFFTKKAKRIYQIFLEADEEDILDFINSNNEVEEEYKDIISGLLFFRNDINEKLAKDKSIELKYPKEDVHQALLSIEIEKNNNKYDEEIDSEVLELDEEQFKKIMQRDNKNKATLLKRNETISV